MFRRLKQLAPALIAVPAGPFLLGSTEAQLEAAAAQFELEPAALHDELPQQRVELPAFEIGRGAVTNAEYEAFVTATDHPTPAYWAGDVPPRALQDHPVVEVSWNDARAYCRWLSTATGRSFRLPSEAEWEKAARGDDGRTFPWGEQPDPACCTTAAGGATATTPVGDCPADTSPYGCVDMAGNVAEWTATRYAPYPGSAALATNGQVVVRGGRWDGPFELARCARRQALDPMYKGAGLGFRVVGLEE